MYDIFNMIYHHSSRSAAAWAEFKQLYEWKAVETEEKVLEYLKKMLNSSVRSDSQPGSGCFILVHIRANAQPASQDEHLWNWMNLEDPRVFRLGVCVSGEQGWCFPMATGRAGSEDLVGLLAGQELELKIASGYGKWPSRNGVIICQFSHVSRIFTCS